MFDEQSLVDTIRRMIKQDTKNGARIQYHEGYVSDASSYLISAYVNGDDTFLSTSIIPITGAYLGAGDYIQVATQTDSGWSWVSRIKETKLYSMLSVDANRGRILLGDGNTTPLTSGISGQVLKSGGPNASAYWSW